MHEHNVGGIDRAHLIKKMMDYIVENNGPLAPEGGI
jgi:dipeptidyl-peptidase-4